MWRRSAYTPSLDWPQRHIVLPAQTQSLDQITTEHKIRVRNTSIHQLREIRLERFCQLSQNNKQITMKRFGKKKQNKTWGVGFNTWFHSLKTHHTEQRLQVSRCVRQSYDRGTDADWPEDAGHRSNTQEDTGTNVSLTGHNTVDGKSSTC